MALKNLLFLCFYCCSLALYAEEGPNSNFFDSVALKHKVHTYKMAHEKVEELHYQTTITYYNPKKVMNPLDSSMEDTFLTQEVKADICLLRIRGKVYQSISTEECRVPESLAKLDKAFVLPDGSLGILCYDAQKGHSFGICGSATRLNVYIYTLYFGNPKPILGILSSACNGDKMTIYGIKKSALFFEDSTILFTPNIFKFSKKELILECEKNTKDALGNLSPYAGKKKIFTFIKEKYELHPTMREE